MLFRRRTPVDPLPLSLGAAALIVGVVGVAMVTAGSEATPRVTPPPVVALTTPTPEPTLATPSPRATTARTLYPLPAPVGPRVPGCPVTRKLTGPPYKVHHPGRLVPDSELPPDAIVPARQPSLDVLRGKGMWTSVWRQSEGGNATRLVARARAMGVRQLWVRTGSSRQGFYAAPELTALLPRAHAAGIAVIGWDFVYLRDPVADAKRAAQTLAFTAPGGHRLDGFSPDVETPGEGAVTTARRSRVYLSRVAVAAGNRPIVLTVPRVTEKRLRSYPYAHMARYADAFAPMVYWSCNEPGALAEENLRVLSRWRPVHLIGQAYDMGVEGGRPGPPRGSELWRFLDVGRRKGALGVSFYVWQTATEEQLAAVGGYPWSS